MARISTFIRSALGFVLASVPAYALALTNQRPKLSAPELDPNSAAAVVVLLVGVALLVQRRTTSV